MNKQFKIFTFGFFLMLIFLVIFPFVGADGGIELIVNSPLEGSVYNLGDDVLFSGSLITTTNDLFNVFVVISLPDGTFQTLNMVLSGMNYEVFFVPSLEGTYYATIYAEDINGNSDSEDLVFYVNKNILSSGFSLFINSPLLNSSWQINEEIPFIVSIISSSDINFTVWAEVECTNGIGLITNIILENNGVGGYVSSFAYNQIGTCKSIFYAQDEFGNQESEETLFYIVDNFQSEFNLTVLEPLNNEIFEKEEMVNFKAKINSSWDSQVIISVEVEMPNGQIEIINLTSLDNIFFTGSFSNTGYQGNYKATFLAQDSFGHFDQEIIYFEIEDSSFEGSGGSGGSGDEVTTRYYLCIGWSGWSECVGGIQDRVCINQIKSSNYKNGSTLTSQLGIFQEKACSTQIIDLNEKSHSSSRITGSVIDFFGSTGTLVILIFFVLLLFLLLIILAVLRRKKS